jgi:peptidoglycan/xylan/chitin deacetylase (PgdA/CDA1 family)
MIRPFLVLLLLGGFVARAQSTVNWPHHKKATIVLTYDDALQSQLNIAVPQLEAANFKATFFLTGYVDYTTIPRWRKLARKGYELANHTIFHPCMPGNDNTMLSDHYTPYSMIHEIDYMNHFLFAIDGKTTRTYAYPCTEPMVGNGVDYADTLRKFGLVKYARVGGDVDAIITDFKKLDKLQVPSYGLEGGETSDKLISFVKSVQKAGGMGVIMFHGVGGDYLTVSAEAHQQLLNYLTANKADIWVTTFQQAMDYATGPVK